MFTIADRPDSYPAHPYVKSATVDGLPHPPSCAWNAINWGQVDLTFDGKVGTCTTGSGSEMRVVLH